MVFSVLLPTGLAWSIQFADQYDSLLHRKLLLYQKLTQALTLLQYEFGFFSRSVETLLKAVEKGKRKRMQVDIKYFPFIPSLSSVSVMWCEKSVRKKEIIAPSYYSRNTVT